MKARGSRRPKFEGREWKFLDSVGHKLDDDDAKLASCSRKKPKEVAHCNKVLEQSKAFLRSCIVAKAEEEKKEKDLDSSSSEESECEEEEQEEEEDSDKLVGEVDPGDSDADNLYGRAEYIDHGNEVEDTDDEDEVACYGGKVLTTEFAERLTLAVNVPASLMTKAESEEQSKMEREEAKKREVLRLGGAASPTKYGAAWYMDPNQWGEKQSLENVEEQQVTNTARKLDSPEPLPDLFISKKYRTYIINNGEAVPDYLGNAT